MLACVLVISHHALSRLVVTLSALTVRSKAYQFHNMSVGQYKLQGASAVVGEDELNATHQEMTEENKSNTYRMEKSKMSYLISQGFWFHRVASSI